MTLTVGLTGGIASGKSLVGDLFAQLEVPVIDADQISREVVLPGSTGLKAVVDHFGTDILDQNGQMDRRHMRERVFAHPQARQELEKILHPLIRSRLEVLRDEAFNRNPDCYCILMIPLLVKFGWTDIVDRLLVVDCSESTQRQRLISRDDIDESLAQNMLDAQDSRQQRLDAADDIIFNEGSPDDLTKPVEELHNKYLHWIQQSRRVQ